MKKYKVINTQDIFQEGDVFIENTNGTFTCSEEEKIGKYTYGSKITVNRGCMQEAITAGIVEEVVENDILNCVNVDNRIINYNTTLKELDKLIVQYQEDLDTTQINYSNGEITEMQKAEAITVLSNLLKLANRIKDLLTNKK